MIGPPVSQRHAVDQGHPAVAPASAIKIVAVRDVIISSNLSRALETLHHGQGSTVGATEAGGEAGDVEFDLGNVPNVPEEVAAVIEAAQVGRDGRPAVVDQPAGDRAVPGLWIGVGAPAGSHGGDRDPGRRASAGRSAR